jgi:dinuclear metal center YbgI/SA1388 family protein
MPVSRCELVSFLDELLPAPSGMHDHSNNGLQIEGDRTVHRAVFGVDACLQLFLEAAAQEAQFVFVHHGLSWGDSLKYLTGTTAERLRVLFQHGISLYGCHLPLDCNPEVGHNAEIARRLQLADPQPFAEYGGVEIGFWGCLESPIPMSTFAATVERALNTEVEVVPGRKAHVHRVGVLSGGGDDLVGKCLPLHLDTYLTGELKHETYHTIRESGITVLAGGHYRTETPGVEAVMSRVQNAFDVECTFIDLPTGM